MADLSISLQADYSKNGSNLNVSPAVADLDLAGDELVSGVLTVTEADALVIPLGPVTTPGLAILTNLDADNFITLGYDDDGFESVMKILPSATVIVSLDDLMDAPYAQADTADCLLRYTIFEQ